MADEGYELELTLRYRYKANPIDYPGVEDTADDVTAYELARIDANNFHEDPVGMMEMLMDKAMEITVAPVITID